jgi:hypothetical protein
MSSRPLDHAASVGTTLPKQTLKYKIAARARTMPSGSKLAVRPEATEAEPPASDAAGVEKSSSAVLMLPAT